MSKQYPKSSFKSMGFSVDEGTKRMIEEIAEVENLHNRSAVLRRVVAYYYENVIMKKKQG